MKDAGTRRMGGRWSVFPDEVADILLAIKDNQGTAVKLYLSLVSQHYIEEDWESGGSWVVGKVNATKMEIITKSHTAEGAFYSEVGAWSKLKDAGLIEEIDREIYLPMYKKKSDAVFSIGEVRAMGVRIDKIEELLFDRQGGERGLFTAAAAAKAAESQAKTEEPNEMLTPASVSEEITSVSEDISSVSEVSNPPTSLSGSRERDPEEEDRARGRAWSKELAVLESESDERKFVRGLIDDLWPGRGYREDDEEYISLFVDNFSRDALVEAFAAAKKKGTVKRLAWIKNRLEDPEVYAGGDVENGGRGESQVQDHGSRNRDGRRPESGNRDGPDRVGGRQWPKIE